MTAELLREAAALMRKRAERTAVPHHPYGDVMLSRVETTEAWSAEIADYLGGSMGIHAASWHPTVALAVADWLDSVASAIEPDPGRPICNTDEQAALTVARAYLGALEAAS